MGVTHTKRYRAELIHSERFTTLPYSLCFIEDCSVIRKVDNWTKDADENRTNGNANRPIMT